MKTLHSTYLQKGETMTKSVMTEKSMMTNIVREGG